MKRHATAIWKGSLKEKGGTLTTQSKVLDNKNYSFHSRFEEGEGTNPEELIAAAHAGCFSMQLSAFIGEAGFHPESIETKSEVTLVEGSIISSHLNVKAKVDGISNETFQDLVLRAEKNCPVSKALKMEIRSMATLV